MVKTIIATCGGVARVHKVIYADGSKDCVAQWSIDPAGYVFAKCEHFLTLTDMRVLRD